MLEFLAGSLTRPATPKPKSGTLLTVRASIFQLRAMQKLRRADKISGLVRDISCLHVEVQPAQLAQLHHHASGLCMVVDLFISIATKSPAGVKQPLFSFPTSLPSTRVGVRRYTWK